MVTVECIGKLVVTVLLKSVKDVCDSNESWGYNVINVSHIGAYLCIALG